MATIDDTDWRKLTDRLEYLLNTLDDPLLFQQNCIELPHCQRYFVLREPLRAALNELDAEVDRQLGIFTHFIRQGVSCHAQFNEVHPDNFFIDLPLVHPSTHVTHNQTNRVVKLLPTVAFLEFTPPLPSPTSYPFPCTRALGEPDKQLRLRLHYSSQDMEMIEHAVKNPSPAWHQWSHFISTAAQGLSDLLDGVESTCGPTSPAALPLDANAQWMLRHPHATYVIDPAVSTPSFGCLLLQQPFDVRRNEVLPICVTALHVALALHAPHALVRAARSVSPQLLLRTVGVSQPVYYAVKAALSFHPDFKDSATNVVRPSVKTFFLGLMCPPRCVAETESHLPSPLVAVSLTATPKSLSSSSSRISQRPRAMDQVTAAVLAGTLNANQLADFCSTASVLFEMVRDGGSADAIALLERCGVDSLADQMTTLAGLLTETALAVRALPERCASSFCPAHTKRKQTHLDSTQQVLCSCCQRSFHATSPCNELSALHSRCQSCVKLTRSTPSPAASCLTLTTSPQLTSTNPAAASVQLQMPSDEELKKVVIQVISLCQELPSGSQADTHKFKISPDVLAWKSPSIAQIIQSIKPGIQQCITSLRGAGIIPVLMNNTMLIPPEAIRQAVHASVTEPLSVLGPRDSIVFTIFQLLTSIYYFPRQCIEWSADRGWRVMSVGQIQHGELCAEFMGLLGFAPTATSSSRCFDGGADCAFNAPIEFIKNDLDPSKTIFIRATHHCINNERIGGVANLYRGVSTQEASLQTYRFIADDTVHVVLGPRTGKLKDNSELTVIRHCDSLPNLRATDTSHVGNSLMTQHSHSRQRSPSIEDDSMDFSAPLATAKHADATSLTSLATNVDEKGDDFMFPLRSDRYWISI